MTTILELLQLEFLNLIGLGRASRSLKVIPYAVLVFSLALLITLTTTSGLASFSSGKDTEVHGTGVIAFDLGSEGTSTPRRGSITLKLTRGVIDSTEAECWFYFSDADSDDICDEFGAKRAQILREVPDSAVNEVYLDQGVWHFPEDPGFTARFGFAGVVLPPVSNPQYSPLKRFLDEDGDVVTANMPMVVWGTEPGQSLIIDTGGCDPLIRANPPSPFFIGGGPANGGDCQEENPQDRYKGGQVLDIDLEAQTVTMKLHKAIFANKKVPYYIVFEASKAPPAGFMGVPHAPKLANLGRFQDEQGTGLIVQFGNGVPFADGGPNRFQPGVSNYRGGNSGKYTPMWVIWFAYFTKGIAPEDLFISDRNVGEGAVPEPFSGLHRFDPAIPESFDPFQIQLKGVECSEYAREVSETSDGLVPDLNTLFDLADSGKILLTEAPGGLRLNSPLQPSLIVNCPVELTVYD